MKVRQAAIADADAISAIFRALWALGKRKRPCDPAFVRAHYLTHAHLIQCFVAEEAGSLLGMQALKRAWIGNEYDVAPGWGIIGTHVSPDAARCGVGSALFAETLEAAQRAGLTRIDATISLTSEEGLGFYDAMGFQTYKSDETSESKILKLSD